ncbi:MAG TPA: FAD-dependent oxidoreductase [Candidatus Borkfalkia stercoripullorum]|nr:FAD-dependent oxidoreductase [Candidatus Borkfalkia stercoripullorum]
MKYVIIGNSTAALYAVEGIRSVDKKGKITIVSDEKHPAYGRPLISYYLYGKTDLEHIAYRPADFYEKMGVDLILGERAVKIEPKEKRVLLQSGKKAGYDKLLVATGSRPFVPPMEGLEEVENKFSFMKLDDAFALEKALSPEKDVLIVGAGLIGLKCMEGILGRCRSVTVIDLADRILPSILDEGGAAFVQKQLEKKGVRFLLGDSAAKFGKNVAYTKNGKEVPFDVLVVAVGVRPNTELVKDAGGEVVRGIVTDDGQRTSIPDVFAAGDNCESFDISSGTRRILALLPNAALQGECAGVNMAGGDAHFANAVPMNAIGFFGSHIATAGVYEGECFEDIAPDHYKKLFYKDNELKGYILIDCIERAGIYTSLIRNKTPLSEVDFKLLEKSPALMAFSAAARREKLARRQ